MRVNQIEVTREQNAGHDETGEHTLETATAFREAVAAGWPDGRITWAFSWRALLSGSPDYRAIRDYAKACHKRYGDDVTFIPGAFFSNAYNSREPINQKQTRPQDNPVPLDALAEADRQLIGRYYPDLEP